MSEPAEIRMEYIWVFGNQSIKIINNERIIFARLGKIKWGFEDTIYDKERGSFNRVTAESPRALEYSNFIIHPKRHLILFEERIPSISITLQVFPQYSEAKVFIKQNQIASKILLAFQL